MSTEGNVATIALIVSLIALLIALLQLLQQIFGTAQEYRRCQESIIGPWSGLRQRKFRLSELRMETQFRTPEIFLLDDSDKSVQQHDIYQFSAKNAHRLVPDSADFQRGQVGWLPLLSSLKELEQNYDSYNSASYVNMFEKLSVPYRRRPVFQPSLQSWD